MSNFDPHDKQGKDGMDAVSRAYRDARDSDNMMPPPALDDAIRAAARRAVHAGPQPTGKSWVRKWTPQLAAAAVIVLSVSVLFVSVEERPDLAPAPIQELALKRQAEAPATVKVPLETKIVMAKPAFVPPPEVPKDAATERANSEFATSPVDPKGIREKALVKKERDVPSVASPSAQLSASATSVTPPVYAPPAPPATATTAPGAPASVAANSAPAPFPATGADAGASKRKEAPADTRVAAATETRRMEEKIAVAGTVRSRDAMDAPAKPAAPTVATVTPAPSAVMKQLAPAPAPAAPVAAAAAPTRALELDAGRRNAQVSESLGVRGFSKVDGTLSDKPVPDERPGPWLKRLLELREQNKLMELREEIVRFRKRHPDVVLPKALTELPQ